MIWALAKVTDNLTNISETLACRNSLFQEGILTASQSGKRDWHVSKCHRSRRQAVTVSVVTVSVVTVSVVTVSVVTATIFIVIIPRRKGISRKHNVW